jgi:hypothetical protein
MNVVLSITENVCPTSAAFFGFMGTAAALVFASTSLPPRICNITELSAANPLHPLQTWALRTAPQRVASASLLWASCARSLP